MEQWKEYKLSDILSIVSGFAYKGEYLGKGESLLLGMGCVSYSELFLEKGMRPYAGEFPERYSVEAGDIVLATRQQSDNLPILGMPAIVPQKFKGKKMVFGANLYKVVPKSPEFPIDYIYWLLKTPAYIRHIRSCQTGTTVRMITKANIEDYAFMCPCKEQRNQISKLLWDIEMKIVLNRRINDNLSNNAIICMHQDPDGYLWIGTYDGLNLYNGKDTYVYRFELNNKNSLCSNIIHKISDAEPGFLWISTSLGINKFSLKKRKVTESYPGYMESDLVATDSSGITLAICKENRISCYTPFSDGFRDLPREGIGPQTVRTLFAGTDGYFYLLLTSGILKKLTPDFSNTTFNLLSEERQFHNKPILSAFHENNHIFIVDTDNKLYRQQVDGSGKEFLFDLSGMTNKYGNIIKICTFQSNVYIVFRNGNILDLSQPENTIDTGIGIFCLMNDKRQEILWVGTDGQGIRMFYDKPDLFGSILLKDLPINIQNPIRSLYTDNDRSLWFGTKGDGIVRIQAYDTYPNKKAIPQSAITHFTTADGLSSNRVYSFQRSEFHPCIWIGTEGPGLCYYSYKENRIKTIPQQEDTPPIRYIHSICEVNDSTLWLATTGNGLLKVTLRMDKVTPTISKIQTFPLKNGENTCKEIQSMIYDNDSTLFLGSRGGYGVISFNIFNQKYEFLQTNNLRNPAIGDVLSVCQTEDSTFYAGASSGLTRIKFKRGKIHLRQFDKSNGIANDMIHGIHEGNDSCIWLSTNKGLTKYNPRNNFFHNYHQPYFSVTEFSDDAYWKCPYSERLFFGGINGLVWVNKQTEPEHTYQPELSFFELQMDKQILPLYKDISRNGVTVPADVQSLTIAFVAPDYINGENYEYSYQLVNYNSSWEKLQKTNKVTFMNLPYGEYLLKVRYRNDVIDSSAKEYTLPIKVLPPIYLSSLAIFTYLFIGTVLIIIAIYRIHYQILKKQKQIADKIKEEQKEKLYESKLNFFTHITHELCTPLTLINGVENYIQAYAATSKDKTLEKYTSVLRENVEELNGLIQEILDFRKAEDAGFSHTHIRRVSVSSLLRTQFEWFYPLSEQHQIQFKIDAPKELYWNTDSVYFKKILANLISNAFKYTEDGGTVRISLHEEENFLVLKVYNTGKGIEEADMQNIFDRYRILGTMDNDDNRQNTARNGLGLFICHSLVQSLGGKIDIESEVGQYAEFTVTLPFGIVEESSDDTIDEDIPVSLPSPNTDIQKPQISHTAQKETEDKPMILVIDDHKDIVWLITETLSSEYQVQEAYNAEEALEFLKQYTPSLIITDIMMPNIDGLELISLIKENRYTRHIPLIIVSAKISDQEQAAGLNIGADAYLTKPFSPTVLLSVVNRLMTNQRELKEYFYSPESAYQYTEGQLLHQEDKEFLDAVTAIIKENVSKEGLGPELVADALNINTRILYRRFKKISTMTPSDFIKDYRLNYAAQLLVNTNMSVQEIIYNVGISNKSYFYREFARKYNMTPKEYRTKEA